MGPAKKMIVSIDAMMRRIRPRVTTPVRTAVMVKTADRNLL